MYIDVLIATAEKGGVENIIKMMIEDLECPNMHFRVVQLVWEGNPWLPEGAAYYPLLKGKGDYSLDIFTEAYSNFLSLYGIPDIVLATVWPYTISVAKNALSKVTSGSCNTKVVSWMHHGIDEYKRSFEFVDEWLCLADGHLAINKSNFLKLYDMFDPKLVYRVRNPVNMPGRPTRSCGKGKQTGLKLGYVGRISKEKNLGLLLRAISETGSCTLTVVGKGEGDDYEKGIYTLAKELKIDDRIKWLGWKSEPWKYMTDIDAICMPSVYEGFPLTALEALSNGIPVIAAAVDGIDELIEEGKNGYIFDINDQEQLVKIIKELEKDTYESIDPNACYDSVMKYERHLALWDTNVKLMALFLEESLIPNTIDKPWYIDEQYERDMISVIIPCHNTEKFIGECLNSVLSQRITIADFEIICIDDASSDNTLAILQEFEKQYEDRIMLIPLDKNVRQGGARNIGLSYANGDYIVYVDSDDIISPNILDRLYRTLIKYEADVAGCGWVKFSGADTEIFDPNGTSSVVSYDLKDVRTRKEFIMEHGWKTGPWARMYPRLFIEDNNISFPENTYMEDIFFSELIMMSLDRYVYIDEPMYGY